MKPKPLAPVTDPARLPALDALVPTMGALHEGHAALIRRAAAEHRVVGVSVFVNPLQFGPGEDLEAYPRTLDADTELAAAAGAACVFAPEVDTLYPPGFATEVVPAGLACVLEGAHRPGHFSGVATVVLKLLNLTRPRAVYFGEKDWQQLQVVRRMVTDLHLGVEVVAVPTVRGEGGLALSSRNRRLNDEDLPAAQSLYAALSAMQGAARPGMSSAELVEIGRARLHPGALPDYLEVADESGAQRSVTPGSRALIAARVGGVRLIDNLALEAKA